jgi:hypothetical protein
MSKLAVVVAVPGRRKWQYMDPRKLAGREPAVVDLYLESGYKVSATAGPYCPVDLRPLRTGRAANFTGTNSK